MKLWQCPKCYEQFNLPCLYEPTLCSDCVDKTNQGEHIPQPNAIGHYSPFWDDLYYKGIIFSCQGRCGYWVEKEESKWFIRGVWMDTITIESGCEVLHDLLELAKWELYENRPILNTLEMETIEVRRLFDLDEIFIRFSGRMHLDEDQIPELYRHKDT